MKSYTEMKTSKIATDFSGLAEKLTVKKTYKDDRFWYPQRDEAGNARAVIRFIEPIDPENDPYFVQTYRHGFKDINGSFYRNCRTTLNDRPDVSGEECPVCQANKQFFEQFGGYDETPKAQQLSRSKYFRRMNRVSNIYVVSDPANPENEGKVFLMRYGAQILNVLMKAVKPNFPNDPCFDPFDLQTGANMEFRITRVDNQTNYESSYFEPVSPLFNDVAKIEKVWHSQYSLHEFAADDQFPSYEQQLRDWNRVTGGQQPIITAEPVPVDMRPTAPPPAPVAAVTPVAPVPVAAAPAAVVAPTVQPVAAPDTPADLSTPADDKALPDDALAFFESLGAK